MQGTTTSVIGFPVRKNVEHVENSKVLDDFLTATAGPGRVQVRMNLDTLEQTQKDLLILQSAIEKALTHVRSGMRRGDPTALGAVRQILVGANKVLNAYMPKHKKQT